MSIDRPPAEVVIDAALVRQLLSEQFPELADRAITLVGDGWDNVIHRLGDELLVRLPRRQAAADLIGNEQRCLPLLAPLLPLAVPVPTHCGRPSATFPWAWSVVPWIAGGPAFLHPRLDRNAAAVALAEFVRALHQPAPADAPPNAVRGGGHGPRLERITKRIRDVHASGRLHGDLDAGCEEIVELWHRLAAAPDHTGPAVWLHGDLHGLNILADERGVCAVIDFGDVTSGDPATDVAVAWILFDSPARSRFRALVDVDDATWTRAMAWALSFGVMYLGAGADDAAMDAMGRFTLTQVLQDNAATTDD